MDWSGKKVIVGVTGSIAVFKACELVSQIRQRGASVRVAASPEACRLVSPVTLRALSGEEPITDLFSSAVSPVPHIALAEWGDALVIVPATAHMIAKCAVGLADDPVSAIALCFSGPILMAPAMETKMWLHPATQDNVVRLKKRGSVFVGPVEGWLASGKKGLGRMAEVETILAELEKLLFPKRDLEGLKVVVTVGATREPLDPVRFLSNRSSGKMGSAIAQVARERGADVVLIAGQMEVEPPPDVPVRKVETAQEMMEQVMALADWLDIFVGCAAVSDYTVDKQEVKIPRRQEPLTITLKPTPDILSAVRQRRPDAFLVGFSAETGDPITRASRKLKEKGLNLIAANDVSRPDSGFGSDTNLCTFISADGSSVTLPLLTKREVAERLWDAISQMVKDRK